MFGGEAGVKREMRQGSHLAGLVVESWWGRGNLNRLYKLLILNEYIGFVFILECHLECQQSLLGTVERVDGALLPYHSSTTC